MNKFDLIKNLIDYVEEYEAVDDSTSDMSLQKFKEWLIVRFATEQFESSGRDTNRKNFELLALMQQYVSRHIRESLRDTGISTIWDFIFLAILSHQGDMGMVDLIKIARMEKSSGMEVLKRIQSSKYVRSVPDKNDKRKKLQQITDLGQKKLLELYPVISKLSETVNGDLTTKEKGMLFHLLNKLDSFHQKKLGFDKAS
ncbi:MarR family winged helix-turn-helix transcriptional regulator [Tunicatimonas pelagia]|uniref:MarR family winged helix-turn-helix transcriptional regulator n=1 Tax=Tunicatimonas pelagia TaxID=931531 RepID=UPI0026655320|nr:MarR family winged helix-turn-helix transcriptional regulator [Tunicatimonas pelagia]WKN45268.1 MarR family winged helix-turn-helix transcriptional regulator [Tunicatimonas pelagia]